MAVKHSINDLTYEEQLILKDRALSATAEGITISDPSLPDNPLIYANEGFERLTGYSIEEVLGRNCRFLQGRDTAPETVAEIRDAIRQDRPCTVQILNYRQDGTPFWNRLSITPVRDASGKVTHHIGVQSDITEQKHGEEELRRAKQELETAYERTKRELDAAAKVQRSLLPETLLDIPGIRFTWRFHPSAELAGDVLNIFRLGGDHVGVYVLDVSGHGVAAALTSVTISRLLAPILGRSFVFADEGLHARAGAPAAPIELVRKLNAYFPFDPRTAQFFTLIYGLIDTRSRKFRYVAAGHPPPILSRHEEPPRVLDTSGPPVGIFPEPSYSEYVVHLKPGDRVWLYTDGIFEAENAGQHEFGFGRLLRSLAATRELPVEDSAESLLNQVRAWSASPSPQDDMSLLAFEITPD